METPKEMKGIGAFAHTGVPACIASTKWSVGVASVKWRRKIWMVSTKTTRSLVWNIWVLVSSDDQDVSDLSDKNVNFHLWGVGVGQNLNLNILRNSVCLFPCAVAASWALKLSEKSEKRMEGHLQIHKQLFRLQVLIIGHDYCNGSRNSSYMPMTVEYDPLCRRPGAGEVAEPGLVAAGCWGKMAWWSFYTQRGYDNKIGKYYLRSSFDFF